MDGRNPELMAHIDDLSIDDLMSILSRLKETEIHRKLEELFSRMYPDSIVEITHGSEEFGKDIVIHSESKLTGENNLAVIVKKGDIGGKTKGKIDEILSQEEQCYHVETHLKNINKYILASDVIIVIFGSLSKNGLKRLSNSLCDKIHTKIIPYSDIVKMFKTYYPEVFIDGEVVTFIMNEMKKIDEKSFQLKGNKSFSEIYVDPFFNYLESPAEIDDDMIKFIYDNRNNTIKYILKMNNTENIIIIGEPGTGKSLTFAKLCMDYYRDAYKRIINTEKKDIVLPYYIKATDHDNVQSPDDIINTIPNVVRNRIKINSILLDGLDEVIPEKRIDVLNKFKDIAGKLDSRLLVSSRNIDLMSKKPEGFIRYEIMPFDYNQAMKLFEKNVKNKILLDTLRKGLEQYNKQVPMTPMSLMLMIEIVEKYNEIPATITELYERYTDIVLGKDDRSRGIEIIFDYYIKKKFLSELAYHVFYKNNIIYIDEIELDIFCNNYMKDYGYTKKVINKLIKELERSSLLEHSNSTIYFKHRSFLDYFIALYFYDNRESMEDLNGTIINLFFDDFWYDVSFFYFGLKKDVKKELIENIFQQEDNFGNNVCKFLIGKHIQAAWCSKDCVKEYAVEKSLEYPLHIRDGIIELINSSEMSLPLITADYSLLTLSDISYNSGVLSKILIKKIYYYLDNPNEENILLSTIIIKSVERFLSTEEKEKFYDRLIENINATFNNNNELRGRFLLLSLIIVGDNKHYERILQSKLKRLYKTDKKALEKVLPLISKKNKKNRKGRRR